MASWECFWLSRPGLHRKGRCSTSKPHFRTYWRTLCPCRRRRNCWWILLCSIWLRWWGWWGPGEFLAEVRRWCPKGVRRKAGTARWARLQWLVALRLTPLSAWSRFRRGRIRRLSLLSRAQYQMSFWVRSPLEPHKLPIATPNTPKRRTIALLSIL